MLRDLIPTLRDRGIEVALARLSAEQASSQADRLGVLAMFGPGRVFRSVEEAVRALRPAKT